MKTPDQESRDWKHSFSPRDFLDARGIAAKLLRPPNPLLQSLAARLTPAGRSALAQPGTSAADLVALVKVLAAEFNALIRGGLLFEPVALELVPLRPVTKKFLATNPEGQELIRLNKLVLQDIFPTELLHEGSDPLGPRLCKGIQFSVYRVRRVGLQTVTDSYVAIYSGLAGRRSTCASDLTELETKMTETANELLAGNAPLTRAQWKLHLENSKAYSALLKELARIKQTEVDRVQQFVAEAVAAQLAIGAGETLLSFVHKSQASLPKDVKPCLLKSTLAGYKTFCKHGRAVAPETLQKRLNTIERFVNELPQCERMAQIITARQAQSEGVTRIRDLTPDAFFQELEAAQLQAGKQHPDAGVRPQPGWATTLFQGAVRGGEPSSPVGDGGLQCKTAKVRTVGHKSDGAVENRVCQDSGEGGSE
jgi:hypothetical protein